MSDGDFECSEAEEGVHESHCFHDVPATDKHFPGAVCCWCGDIFAVTWEECPSHGEYLPDVFRKKTPKKRKR